MVQNKLHVFCRLFFRTFKYSQSLQLIKLSKVKRKNTVVIAKTEENLYWNLCVDEGNV